MSRLTEELEDDARAWEAAARYGEALGMPSADVRNRAARCRARAERIRELTCEFTEVERFKYDAGYQDALRKLTGPVDTSPERPTHEVLCRGCGKPLEQKNYRVADGCECNAPRGVNHGLVARSTCTCVECDPAQTGSTRYPAIAGEAVVKPQS